MENYTTLTQFIEEQCTKFEIPNTEKNQRKLRIKFTRTLKKLGIWDNAESKLIGRKHTKVFTHQQLQQLYNKVEPYLLKHSDIDIEELEEYRQNLENYVEEISNQTNESYQQQLEAEQYEPPDVQKWNQDKATIHFSELSDMTDTDYVLASMRLNNPVQSYTKEK